MASAADSMPIADVETECFTCDAVQAYVDLTKNFSSDLSNALHDPMLIVFASLAGLWIVLSAIKLPLKLTDTDKIIQDFVFITITGILLGSQGNALISYVYSTSLEIIGGSSNAVFSITGKGLTSTSHSGLTALTANGELAVYKVFQAAGVILDAASLANAAYYIYAFFLVVPYFLLIVAYAAQMVVVIYRVTIIAVFAPFLFMAFAFGWGRDMAKSGAKTLLASIMIMFACTASLALTIYGVAGLTIDPAKMSGDKLNELISISNPAFLAIMFLGWAGTALMAEGTGTANSIAGTALTNTAAGILTAGASATGLGMLKGAGSTASAFNPFTAGGRYMGVAGWIGSQLGGWQKMGEHAGNLVDKFKNINKPGGGA